MVLSPSHFLYPYNYTDSISSIIPPPTETAGRLQAGWKATQSLLSDFWRRFRTEYLNTFLRRAGKGEFQKLKVGDVVLLCDDNSNREHFATGVVKNILSSDPDHPRAVRVKDANGMLKDRHVRGLIKLELSE